MTDPFVVLGLAPGATVAEIRAARRRLAVSAHPDHGGSEEQMKTLNAAYEAALARAGQGSAAAAAATPAARPAPSPASAPESEPEPGPHVRRMSRRVQQDIASFTVDALPVEAFEALLIVTSWIGEVLVDEPPYLLEVFLREPEPCWCRLDLVPDAGGSTVSLMVAGLEGVAPPDLDDVRDVWVAHLNQLGRWEG